MFMIWRNLASRKNIQNRGNFKLLRFTYDVSGNISHTFCFVFALLALETTSPDGNLLKLLYLFDI